MTDLQQARLDAIALARAILAGDSEGARVLLDLSDDPRELAQASAGFTASLLAIMPAERRDQILDGMTEAALGPDGERP